MQIYPRKVAEVIIKSRIDEFEVSDDGIRPREVPVENAEFDQLINWTPSCELDGEDAPDPMTAPALPFPFTANQLAAFMIHGCGYFAREQFGDWADGPDPQSLAELGTKATKARQALIGAFNAYRAAECVVGTYDRTYSEKIQELEKQYGQWPDAPEARLLIKQAYRDADDYEADRRKQMVNQLLAVGQVPAEATDEPAVDGKKWTPEKLAELSAYRKSHTMLETSKQFGISGSRIRLLLPTKKAKAKPFASLIHRMK